MKLVIGNGTQNNLSQQKRIQNYIKYGGWSVSGNLLSRDEWREAVFSRDKRTCVYCGATATAVHHIIERRLWTTGGYYLDNGVSLCDQCHFAAESTVLSCSELRDRAGIASICLPDHFDAHDSYDKWGNVILSDSTRLPGELYYEEGVQKIIRKDVIFQKYVKYPRTMHLPWSPNLQNDDRVIQDLSTLEGSLVVVTEKMDGENTSMYDDNVHARSINSGDHPSRRKIREIFNSKKHDIPPHFRVCGENMYARPFYSV
jgi:hypothetical protein